MFEVNGPWEAVGSLVRTHYNGHGGFLIADCHSGTTFTSEQCQAHAQLCAAAPEMLEMLREFDAWLAFRPDLYIKDGHDRVKALIAKATGANSGDNHA